MSINNRPLRVTRTSLLLRERRVPFLGSLGKVGADMKTEITTNNVIETERPWWAVRASLTITLSLLLGALITMLAPTPFHAWVFDSGTMHQLANH